MPTANKQPECIPSKFSTISVDKTVHKPSANWLTILFQKKFLSSPIHEAEFSYLKTMGYKPALPAQGNT
jgi:hypothetical protein